MGTSHSYLLLTLLFITKQNLYSVVAEPTSLPIPNPETGTIELPGHINDIRGLPNLPFSVNSNRNSDGVSSVSPLSDTAPSFPVYKRDGTIDPTFRKDHEISSSQNRLTQGTAVSGSGAFDVEFSRYRLLKSADWNDLAPPPNPTVAFEVNATLRWNPSNFAIQAGESYVIEVLGEQKWGDLFGEIEIDTLGYSSHYDARKKCNIALGECRSYLRNTKRYKSSNWLSLICGVGDYVTLIQETAHNERFMPLIEQEFVETLFYVGDKYVFTANANMKQTGELVCFANDAEGLYYDNVGSLEVKVTRTSWPPTGDFEPNYEKYMKTQLENYEALGVV
ncbi:hypothetical protein ScalyP_jg1870 [Parmales sp. scaly parma]|jgi:hypothetical protein|nr:hypothetical protein ScalyP_jg1870 [Parmales sp. scaly parma]